MKKTYVYIITIFSCLFFVLLIGGFSTAILSQFKQPSNEQVNQTATTKPIEKNGEKIIVALGDSLTRGTGDPNGLGYVGYLKEELEEKSDTNLQIQNLAVNGYQSKQLLEQIQGRSVQQQLKNADMILITIGGNDLFQGGQTYLELKPDSITQLKDTYLTNVKETLRVIRSVNEKAVIYFIGLYNPFIDLNDAELTTAIVRDWNYETNKMVDEYDNAVFVPTFDLFQMQVNDYLYSDKFHPNTKGYQLIAERLASLITW